LKADGSEPMEIYVEQIRSMEERDIIDKANKGKQM